MGVRGALAKENVIRKIKEAFGDSFIGEVDKKIYVTADDGGEKVQIALTLTCPKNPVTVVNRAELNYNTGLDFSSEDNVAVPPERTEISEEERKNVRKLMKRMGL